MALVELARTDAPHCLLLNGQEVEWRLVHSSAAKRLRIKVGPDGVKVVLPEGRDSREAAAFVADNRGWVAEQLERTRRLLAARRPANRADGRIAFRGNEVAVRILHSDDWRAPNKVALDDGAITITCAPNCKTPASRSLENWLRKQVRECIARHVAEIAKRLKHTPNRVYVMDQRTKWGNCSRLGNLSFNWRLVMAPDAVLRYIVTHEMVHLAVPDHSAKFWLTVQSLCPDTERARQWLAANGQRLQLTELGAANG
ncbi:MAG: M48 family metallopeptidase [Azoarcus sp.]|jgi:predicted metal-dependent hydrolase|nr:M48 family metallopeptidase [Azoarcus sp.]